MPYNGSWFALKVGSVSSFSLRLKWDILRGCLDLSFGENNEMPMGEA